MKALIINPSPEFSSLVDYYIVMKSENGLLNEYSDKYVPDGSAALVFNFIAEKKFITENFIYQLPTHFIVIPNIRSLKFDSKSLFDTFIVKCKASVLSGMFGVSLLNNSEYPHLEANIFCGFPMYERLHKLENNEERIKLFENVLAEHFDPVNYIPDEIDKVYEKIMKSNGNIRINDLLENMNINPRSFRRKFLQRVGLSTKELLRIVRVNKIWELCKNSSEIDFNEIVYQYKFFDQAHFINDFKKILGETPRHFFGRELSQVEFISGRCT